MKKLKRGSGVVEVSCKQVELENGKKALEAVVNVIVPIPEQNEQLPNKVEEMCEETGQELKRIIFRQAIELADLQLTMSKRAGKGRKGIQRIGTRSYRFKTIFGTVKVRRIRIRHKRDRKAEVASAKAWKTPRGVMITKGMRKAVCDLAVKESFSNTVKQLERRTGEERVICKSSVANILHQTGDELGRAQEKRAKLVYAVDKQARQQSGWIERGLDATSKGQDLVRGEEMNDSDKEQLSDCEASLFACTSHRNEAPEVTETIHREIKGEVEEAPATERDLVIVQPDEVVVRAQPGGEQRWIIHYNAVVNTADRNYYFSAGSSGELLGQVESLLSVLGVNKGEKELLLISDCAAWIREWFDKIEITNKRAILCWYHLAERSKRIIRMAIGGKEDQSVIKRRVIDYLWMGQVEEAKSYITEIIYKGMEINSVLLQMKLKFRSIWHNLQEAGGDYVKKSQKKL